jgi:hypothetical protein
MGAPLFFTGLIKRKKWTSMNNLKQKKIAIGWREWLALPDLGILAIKAKIDTGARTSALHTFGLEPFRDNGKLKVRFGIHPLQRKTDPQIHCISDVIDRRRVTNSTGQSEMRYVIQTKVVLGELQWPIELTLTSRKSMRFRMLLGRAAIAERVVLDPAKSYLTGRKLAKIYSKRKAKNSNPAN